MKFLGFLFASAFALASCTAQGASVRNTETNANVQQMNMIGRLGTLPGDFEAHGIKQGAPEIWEDGQRLEHLTPGAFEWWYADGHFSNGMILVTSFHVHVGREGSITPYLNLNISDAERVYVNQSVSYRSEAFSAQKEIAGVRIGSNYFRSLDGLDRYEIFVDPATNNGFGAKLLLEKTVPSWRPGTGRWENDNSDDERFFAWLCTVPGGNMTGTITINGEPVQVEGSGYHDHNWGNAPMNALIGGWYWGRADVEGMSVVMASVRFNQENGGVETPLLYVAKGDDVIVDAVNDELVCQESVQAPHDTGKVGKECSLIVNNDSGHAKVRFSGNQVIVNSSMYQRFRSTTALDIRMNGYDIRAKGTSVLENMNLSR